MQLMFQATRHSDGLEYVDPLPKGHVLYELREFVGKVGKMLDRLTFW